MARKYERDYDKLLRMLAEHAYKHWPVKDFLALFYLVDNEPFCNYLIKELVEVMKEWLRSEDGRRAAIAKKNRKEKKDEYQNRSGTDCCKNFS